MCGVWRLVCKGWWVEDGVWMLVCVEDGVDIGMCGV